MPTLPHEAPLELFREDPHLLPRLIRESLGVKLPPYEEIRTESADFTQLVPTEYRADLVHHLLKGELRCSLIVELQLAKDPDKPFVWPLYAAALRAKTRKPAWVVVVTFDKSVAKWARAPLTDFQPGSSFAPLVIGPEEIPKITLEQAQRSPELAVLSIAAHGKKKGALELARNAIQGFVSLDEEKTRLYADLVLSLLAERLRTQLEYEMETGKYEYQSNFAKKYVAQGRAEGRAEGKAEGEVKGEARALLSVLRGRGFDVSEVVQKKIESCTELATLERWIVRALTAKSAEEAVEEKAPPTKAPAPKASRKKSPSKAPQKK